MSSVVHFGAATLVAIATASALTACGADSISPPAFSEPALFDAGASGAESGPISVDAGSAAKPAGFLGANVEPGGVVFRVWAPNATAARLHGDFSATDLTMSPIEGGIFELHVAGAHAGQAYAFALDTPAGTVARTDPYCRELVSSASGSNPAGTPCTVVDPNSHTWSTSNFVRPTRTSAVVYEMHIGSFAVPSGAPYGTFASATAALSSIADLGVNVIELMPSFDFGSGPFGWGYNPELYFAPKPSYGSPEDLRAFVDRAHALGIAVWLDVVINHMGGWAQAPLRCFDGCPNSSAGIYFFTPGTYATTPWGPRPNYVEPEVATMLTSITDGWMGEFRGDGFRWDSVSNIRAIDGSGTTPGAKDLLTRINDHVHALGGFSVAEDLKGYAAITQTAATGGFGFDAQWDGFGYTVTNVLTQSADANRDLAQIVTALTSSYAGDPFARLIFTEDHDTVGNGGARVPNLIDSANPTSWAARKRSIEGAVLLFTSPGVPMIFQGQEALALGTFTDPPAPLAAPTAQGIKIRAFYKDMIRLRQNLDGGAAGLGEPNIEIFHRNDAAKVIAYRRYGASGQDVIVVVNLMNKSYSEYDVGVSDAGPWRIRLNTDNASYSDDFAAGETGSVTAKSGTKDGKPFALPLALGAYSAMVLTR